MTDTYRNCSATVSSSIGPAISFTNELCSVHFCDAIIHFDKTLQQTIMVEGILRKDYWTLSPGYFSFFSLIFYFFLSIIRVFQRKTYKRTEWWKMPSGILLTSALVKKSWTALNTVPLVIMFFLLSREILQYFGKKRGLSFFPFPPYLFPLLCHYYQPYPIDRHSYNYLLNLLKARLNKALTNSFCRIWIPQGVFNKVLGRE